MRLHSTAGAPPHSPAAGSAVYANDRSTATFSMRAAAVASEDDDEDETCEAWIFRQNYRLHLVLILCALFFRVLTVASQMLTHQYYGSPNTSSTSLALLVFSVFLIAMFLAIRVAAHVANRKRRRCMRLLTVATGIGNIVSMIATSAVYWAKTAAEMGRTGPVNVVSLWPSLLIWLITIPIGVLLTSLLSATLAMNKSLYALLHVFLFISLGGLVLIRISELMRHLQEATGQQAESEAAALVALVASAYTTIFFFSLCIFFYIDSQGRAQFRSFQASRGLAAAKGRYVAAISHDFGTPITMLHMLIERLEHNAEMVARVGERSLQGMHVALELLSTIRSKAINLNKLDRGQQLQPERVSCVLRTLLNDVMLVADHMPKRSGVTVELHIEDEAFPAHERVITDRGWLFMMLVNLLSNAFKNTREGSVRLTVSVLEGPHGPMVRARVADTGQGVPAELEPHLFSSYQQASKWRFGTGLGLYHVRELAAALGGRVGYTCNTPRGAIFDVDVPLVLAVEGPSPPGGSPTTSTPDGSFSNKQRRNSKEGASSSPQIDAVLGSVLVNVGEIPRGSAAAAPAPTMEGCQGGPDIEAGQPRVDGTEARLPSVLVVDDDDFVCDSTRFLLEGVMGDEGGGRIEVAADGEEALQKLTTSVSTSGGAPFDIVLMDAQMPFMDGLACVKRLREWEQQVTLGHGRPRPRIRAIAVSGNAEDLGFHQEAIAAGFDDTIPKPLTAQRAREVLAFK